MQFLGTPFTLFQQHHHPFLPNHENTNRVFKTKLAAPSHSLKMFSVSTQLLLSGARQLQSREPPPLWPEVNETRADGLIGGHLCCCEVTGLMVGVMTTTWMRGGHPKHYNMLLTHASGLLRFLNLTCQEELLLFNLCGLCVFFFLNEVRCKASEE